MIEAMPYARCRGCSAESLRPVLQLAIIAACSSAVCTPARHQHKCTSHMLNANYRCRSILLLAYCRAAVRQGFRARCTS